MLVVVRLSRTGPAFARVLKGLTVDPGSTMSQMAEWLRHGLYVGTVVVVFDGGDVVGWAVSYPDEFSPGGALSVNVFVAPPSRRRGIGTRLLRFLGREGPLAGAYQDGLGKAFYEAAGVPSHWFPGDGWLVWALGVLLGPGEVPGTGRS